MIEELEIIAGELKRLRDEGQSDVYIEAGTLEALRQLQESHAVEYEEPAPDIAGLVAESKPKTAKKTAQPAKKKETGFAHTPPTLTLPTGEKQARWDALRKIVMNDPVCLENGKTKGTVVFGTGSLDADIFFCGEAPGEDEENAGEPFVGPAGEKLTGMIKAMGLSRESVYISNILNWRPDNGKNFNNRAPTAAEIAYGMVYLSAQVQIIQPKVIVGMGKTALEGFLGADPNRRMRDIIGQWQEWEGIPLMPAYHPSYIIHNDTASVKRVQWECLLAVMEKLDMPISDKQRNFFK